MIGETLFRFANPKYILMDFETEGLHLKFSKPWQSAFVVVHDNKIVEEHDDYPFWADLDVSSGAAAITRFDYNEYKNKSIPATDALQNINKFIYNKEYLIIGHNILGYDSMIHAGWCKLLGLPVDYSWLDRAIDTHLIAKALKKQVKLDLTSPQNF